MQNLELNDSLKVEHILLKLLKFLSVENRLVVRVITRNGFLF